MCLYLKIPEYTLTLRAKIRTSLTTSTINPQIKNPSRVVSTNPGHPKFQTSPHFVTCSWNVFWRVRERYPDSRIPKTSPILERSTRFGTDRLTSGGPVSCHPSPTIDRYRRTGRPSKGRGSLGVREHGDCLGRVRTDLNLKISPRRQ